MTTKITDANIDSDKQDNNAFNISLLGFKMAVNEGLTVFNLVDGVVDEFNDESGTDEAEGSNDLYNGTGDFYVNSNTPQGVSICGPSLFSAGFSSTTITEPDTSTAGTNPTYGSGTAGEFTVPACRTSMTAYVWGSGGGGADHGGCGTSEEVVGGGAGGFVTGNLAVTPGQTFDVYVGEGGASTWGPCRPAGIAWFNGGRGSPGSPPNQGQGAASGGGLTGIFSGGVSLSPGGCNPAPAITPQIYMIAGSGGGGGGHWPCGSNPNGPWASGENASAYQGAYGWGGAGGGLIGNVAGLELAQTSAVTRHPTGCTAIPTPAGSIPITAGMYLGGGGSQTAGGQSAGAPQGNSNPGAFLKGGDNTGPDQNMGAGGAGFYGGGGGGYLGVPQSGIRAGGGGSSYIGNPNTTCGSTTEGTVLGEGGGTANPNYVADTNEGAGKCAPGITAGGDNGYILITGTDVTAVATSTTIVSTAFSSTSVPTSSRIVVFEENVDTPTLNTDIIASVSRDGGTTYTNATLTDSGYVTGSSGQRILTGQADISGQPSGQSMRWKLALANNQVKIHGVSLQWS